MYAIVRQGGKQYRIEAGTEVVCDRIKGRAGDAVEFDKVLLISDGNKTIVDAKGIATYKIEAELVDHFLDDKVLVFKYRAKKGYRRKTGHRQQKSRIKIISISKIRTKSKKAGEEEPKKTESKATIKKEASKSEEKTGKLPKQSEKAPVETTPKKTGTDS